MDHDLAHAALEELADTLSRERRGVEQLLYRLVTARLLLEAGEHRFLAAAVAEVDQVARELETAEWRRRAALLPLADHLGLALDDLTLDEVSRRAPRGVGHVIDDHRRAFHEMAAEIERTVALGRPLASAALGRVRRSLDVLAGRSCARLEAVHTGSPHDVGE